MNMGEYRRAVRMGDAIFFLGGVAFVANLLLLLIDTITLVALPAGIVVMGLGAQIQYAANEKLKDEIMLAISLANPDAAQAARALGLANGDATGGQANRHGCCPNCGPGAGNNWPREP